MSGWNCKKAMHPLKIFKRVEHNPYIVNNLYFSKIWLQTKKFPKEVKQDYAKRAKRIY